MVRSMYMHARHYVPALAEFLQPDPSRLETNSHAYARENPVTLTDPSGLETTYFRSDAERRYCFYTNIFNLWNCYTAWNWAQIALGEAQSRFPASTLHNGIGDAYRHCMWAGCLARVLGYNSAKPILDAHEQLPYSVQPWAEKMMDLHNNTWGLYFGSRLSFWDIFWYQTLRDKCAAGTRNGQLRLRP
jgi:hypothetical protein